MVVLIVQANQNQLEQDILKASVWLLEIRHFASLEPGNHSLVEAELARGSLVAIGKQMAVVRRAFQGGDEDAEHFGLLVRCQLRKMVGAEHLPHCVRVGHQADVRRVGLVRDLKSLVVTRVLLVGGYDVGSVVEAQFDSALFFSASLHLFNNN